MNIQYIQSHANLSSFTAGNLEQLRKRGLPECNTDEEIALAMGISVEKLRFLAEDSTTFSSPHYCRFQILKKIGKARIISVPTPELKAAQRWILKHILDKIEIHDAAHK